MPEDDRREGERRVDYRRLLEASIESTGLLQEHFSETIDAFGRERKDWEQDKHDLLETFNDSIPAIDKRTKRSLRLSMITFAVVLAIVVIIVGPPWKTGNGGLIGANQDRIADQAQVVNQQKAVIKRLDTIVKNTNVDRARNTYNTCVVTNRRNLAAKKNLRKSPTVVKSLAIPLIDALTPYTKDCRAYTAKRVTVIPVPIPPMKKAGQ